MTEDFMRAALRLALVMGATTLAACVTVDLPKVRSGEDVQAGTFAIRVPSGEWHAAVEEAGDSVTLLRIRTWLGKEDSRTTIDVFRAAAPPGASVENEDAVAAAFIRDELKRIDAVGRESGDYGTQILAEGARSIGSLRFRWIRYEKTMNFLKFGVLYEHAMLCVHVPPDVESTGAVYVFNIGERFVRGSLNASNDLTQVEPVIESFRLTQSIPATR
jgi:predicted small secreted protein